MKKQERVRLMELHEKLQQLRKQKGLTQEELAQKLFVSRTAISKWESGRGYPSIDSLKEISKFFSVSIDILLSSDEMLELAEKDVTRTRQSIRTLIFGSLDLSAALLLFLPLFAQRDSSPIRCVSLLVLSGVQPYLKLLYLLLVTCTVISGMLALALQNWCNPIWVRTKAILTFTVPIASVLLFTISLQPYAAVFSFSLLAIKVLISLKKT